MKTNWAVKALPASVLALTLCLAPGCSSTDAATSCTLKARIDAVSSAADALVDVSGKMQAKLYTACAAIAGMPADGTATDDKVTAACNAASAAIKAKFSAGVSVTVIPAKCEVAAEAQVSCEASCKSNVMCTEPSVEVRCQPGDLSVQCSGMCTGTLECEGSATVAASCEGSCSGSCTGTCSGTCNGTCDGTCSVKDADGKCAGTCTGMCTGSCSAKCEGTCKGTCEFAADAKVMCDATARCKGMCSVMGTAPKCEGDLTPPMCSGDVNCQGACKGEAKLKAECTPPTVGITGFADADFTATLTDNLPAVFAVAAQAKVVAEGATTLASATGSLIADVGNDIKCAATNAASVAAKLEASAKASVSVSVSVMASASVSSSATTGT